MLDHQATAASERAGIAAVVVLLSVVGVACGAGSSSRAELTEACRASANLITHGPRVGAVTEDTAKIWVRSCQPVDIAVQYKPLSEDGTGDHGQESATVATDPRADNTAVVSLAGLIPATAYDYQIVVEGKLPAEPLRGQFRTLPPEGKGSQLSFIVTSDLHHPQVLPEAMLTTMARQDAAFAVLMGDQLAMEWVMKYLGRCCKPQTQADYELGYREAWAYPPFARFLATTPTVMTWDDHEIYNDWHRGLAPPYPDARAAFEEYVASVNPPPRTPGTLQYTFRAGDVEFYVLDTRTFRTPGTMPDNAAKTMLGAEQKQDLEDWLLSSDARFKFIVSSVMWNDASRHIELGESWPAYRTERDEIFSFIRDNHISGAVLLSGDEHWGGVFRIEPWGIYEIAPAPISWPQPGPKLPVPALFLLRGTEAFGLFTADTTVCPATLTVQIVDKNNQSRYTLHLTELDVSADSGGNGLLPCQEPTETNR